MFWITAEGALESCKVDPTWNDQARSVSRANDDIRLLLTAHIEHQVEGDQDLFEKITPTYPPGGKRMLRDNGVWVEALRRGNVDLITDPITEIVERGIRTDDETVYDADVIIYGTGFKADEFLAPMKITGANGADLHERWAGDARAYLGVTIPGFPNLFSLYGPNTNIVVNGSIIFFSECEMRYIIHCLRHLIDNGKRAMSCKQSVHDQYNKWVDEGNRMMAWGSPHVTSWYKNATGRVAQNWPYTLLEYWTQTKALNPDDYQFS
jgi:4-hydroxyacetophenone monooxygenase